MVAAKVGVETAIGNARIMPTPAAHYGRDVDPVRGHRWLGFVIELNGVTLWHSGDTILFPELMNAMADWTGKIDVACLPVNGRDYWREQVGITGNMDATEALDLCAKLDVEVLIPMHNDLFAGNHVSPAVLAEYQDRKHPRRRYHWLQPGELYVYVK
jgi:L-ascorbate metabolism protein UlaG (beta-lactamase superfamily)